MLCNRSIDLEILAIWILSLLVTVTAINNSNSTADSLNLEDLQHTASKPEDKSSLTDSDYEDFEGPVKKVTVLLMIKRISDDIHQLFAERTEFHSIEKELLKNETKVDYIFPEEEVIIKGIGNTKAPG
jgi:hypothetical protein